MSQGRRELLQEVAIVCQVAFESEVSEDGAEGAERGDGKVVGVRAIDGEG